MYKLNSDENLYALATMSIAKNDDSDDYSHYLKVKSVGIGK